MDSKGAEIAFVAEQIRRAGAAVVTIDVGTKDPPTCPPDIPRTIVARHHPRDGEQACLGHADRGQAVTAMSDALTEFLLAEHAAGKLAGVIGIGGTGGTALITAAMRALPVGLPKLMVSTVGSGNTVPYIGVCDITMMHSVVDVAGLNRVTMQVLANAAHAIAGMALRAPPAPAELKPTLGMTMFGVTTPCVTAVRTALEARGYECLVFHATGTGGQSMEKLVASGLITGVLDVTTTEVADEVVGGVFPAGAARFDIIFDRKIPYVMSLGALDMVNFGAMATVPPQFKERKLHVHNANVTLMRTTPEENRALACWIAAKVNRGASPLTILIPERGVSMLDAPGQAFYDPQADAALFDELERAVQPASFRRVRRLPLHINDPAFADALVEAFLEQL
jgi:uncharacterized protein (UPF0261 family)